MYIHTIQIKCYNEIQYDVPYLMNKGIKNPNGTYSYKINPNKYNGDIYTYAAYTSVLNDIINCLELVNPVVTRVDYAINCYEDNFDKLYKLNKALILLLCIKYNLDNRYGSFDLLTNNKLCCRVQKPRLEIENYNKLLENPKDKTKNRLEFRSKQLYKIQQNKERAEFEEWLNRMHKSVTKDNYADLQNIINNNINKHYIYEKEKQGFTINSFIYRYNNDFFTQNQLAEFYNLTELYKDPKAQARKYKYKHYIEYISLDLLEDYIDIIARAGEKYFTE